MPLTITVLCALLLLPSMAFAEGAAQPTAIFTSFEGTPSPRAVAAMKQEVESLIRPAGFELSWRDLGAPRIEESFSDLVVVQFHGKCHMQGIQLLFSELGPENEPGPLGSTKVTDGQMLPFSELECDRIRRSIAPLAIGHSSNDREALLGRAMGRVLVHELFHIFAKTGKHSHEGVAKTSYSRRDLVADRFELDAKDSKRMQRR